MVFGGDGGAQRLFTASGLKTLASRQKRVASCGASAAACYSVKIWPTMLSCESSTLRETLVAAVVARRSLQRLQWLRCLHQLQRPRRECAR